MKSEFDYHYINFCPLQAERTKSSSPKQKQPPMMLQQFKVDYVHLTHIQQAARGIPGLSRFTAQGLTC